MPSFKKLLKRHWIIAAGLSVSLAVGVTVALSGELRASILREWNHSMAKVGLSQADAGLQKTYWCPMDPQIRSNKPNSVCPICSMALVELEGDATAKPNALLLMPQQVQQTGVATGPVMRRSLFQEINTTGRVTSDERRLKMITTWVRGRSRIEKLAVNFTGQSVKQGELLAVLYSPSLIVAQEEYLAALKLAKHRAPDEFDAQNLAAARRKLRDQGMTAAQIDELKKSRKVLDRVKVFADISGTVIKRHVQQGDYVTEGKMLFQIADLNRLWVFADVFEEEKPLIEVGMKVNLTVATHPGKSFPGTVSFIDPVINAATRTVPVRIDVDNRDGTLSPGMFARVALRHRLPSVLAVPENAVLWSGQRMVVIVKAGEGTFEPREVQLGRKWLSVSQEGSNGRGTSLAAGFADGQQRFHEVLHGLFPGEDVVTSGAFLLNAESQFRNVLVKLLPPENLRVSLSEVVGRPVADRMEAVLAAYFQLSESLADDNIKAAARQLDSLKEAASQLTRTAGKSGTAKLQTDAARFQQLIAKLTATPVKDAKDARTRFGRISHDLTKLLAENGGKTLFGKSLHQFECGMAKVGYERWLWRNPQIHNPYMGRKMLTCGKRLDAFQP